MIKKATKKVRKVRAWAVVPKDEWAYGALLMWNDHLKKMSYAVFTHESFAADYAERMSRMGEKCFVIPCQITYHL